jgi:hypothetical protein
MNTPSQFEYVDEHTLRDSDGSLHEVMAAAAALPWTRQWCPFMPHEYAIRGKSPEQAWNLLEAMIRLSPNSYRAFFRGYERANRYWDAPDGRRYWRSRFEIDRWDASDTEGLRRVDDGAHAIKDWDGPRWAPSGAGYYVEGRPGQWWPSPNFFAEGLEPCRACRNPPAEILGQVGADAYRVVDPSSADTP